MVWEVTWGEIHLQMACSMLNVFLLSTKVNGFPLCSQHSWQELLEQLRRKPKHHYPNLVIKGDVFSPAKKLIWELTAELWQRTHVAKFSVKTEVSQTTPLHTRNFWKHSGTFQDKILGHFRAWGGAKGAQSVLKWLLLMAFFGDLPWVLM